MDLKEKNKNNLKLGKIKQGLIKRLGFLRFYPKVLKKKEARLVAAMAILLLGSLIFWLTDRYLDATEVVPDFGGRYTEGLIGEPKLINPVLNQTNDVDMDLSALVFSGLMRLDKDQNIIPDVADSYEVSEDGKTYTFKIRPDVKFHDDEALTAEDVAFTVESIKNPDFNSPLRLNWQGVESRIIDDYTITFTLREPFAPFVDNTTFGILPKHLWETVVPKNAALAEFNLKPIGSGPFAFDQFAKDKDGQIDSYRLTANKDFYRQRPYLNEIEFKFYPDYQALVEAFSEKETEGISFIPPEQLDAAKDLKRINVHDLIMPRYFAVFFNHRNKKILNDHAVRHGLTLATDRQAIVDQALAGQGLVIDAPILPGFFGYTDEVRKYEFNPDQAKKVFDSGNWKDSNGDGILDKNGSNLEFNLTVTDLPEQIRVAEMLKSQWEAVGARINIDKVSVSGIQQGRIRPREYEALLFGEIFSHDPDPYAFWHSSQRQDPGLNLTSFRHEKIDEWLAEARRLTDQELRETKYKEFQITLADQIYAVFIYSPIYKYGQNQKLKGFSLENIVLPSDRFANVEGWYLRAKRAKIE